MKISNNKNVLLGSKNKDNQIKQKPLFSPRNQRIKPAQTQLAHQYFSPNNRIYSNQPNIINQDIKFDRVNQSPQTIKQNLPVYKNQTYPVVYDQKNIKTCDPKTIQLVQLKKYINQFQNEYENIPRLNQVYQHTPITNNIVSQTPKIINPVYESPKVVYPDQQIIYQNQSPSSSPKNIYNANYSAFKDQVQKTNLSKSKVFSSSPLKKQESNMMKFATHKLGSGFFKKQKMKLTQKDQQLLGLESDKSNSEAGPQLSTSNRNKGSKLKIRQKKQNSKVMNNQFNNWNDMKAQNQYFGNDLNTVVSPYLSPRTQSKKKNNFLRLSKSLQNNSCIKSKLQIQSSKLNNKISFDKMYDQQDFELKNQLKQPSGNPFELDKQSMANSQKQRKMLTSMQSQLKEKKKKYNPALTKNNPPNNKLSNELQEDEKTRLKIPSFKNSLKVNQENVTTIPSNRSFDANRQAFTAQQEYMIQTKNMNPKILQGELINMQLAKNPQIVFSLNKQHLNPQYSQYPIDITNPIYNQSKIAFSPQSHQNKSPLQVINFNHKYTSNSPKISKNVQHVEITTNNQVTSLVPKFLPKNSFQKPQTNIRPHSSMSQFNPSNLRPSGQTQTKLLTKQINNILVSQQQYNVQHNNSYLQKDQTIRRPQSQSIRPISRLQQFSNLNNSSNYNSKISPIAQLNMNSNMLKLNSSVKSHQENVIIDNENKMNSYLKGQYQEVKDSPQVMLKGNRQTIYQLKSKNVSNAMPSTGPSHGLSSIIMGMKSYNNYNNNSYFNQTNAQQNINNLAHSNQTKQNQTRKNNHIQQHGSKPQSSSSNRQSGVIQNTLPIDSKPNSPQHYMLTGNSSAVQNNMRQQSSLNDQFLNLNSNKSKLENLKFENNVNQQRQMKINISTIENQNLQNSNEKQGNLMKKSKIQQGQFIGRQMMSQLNESNIKPLTQIQVLTQQQIQNTNQHQAINGQSSFNIQTPIHQYYVQQNQYKTINQQKIKQNHQIFNRNILRQNYEQNKQNQYSELVNGSYNMQQNKINNETSAKIIVSSSMNQCINNCMNKPMNNSINPAKYNEMNPNINSVPPPQQWLNINRQKYSTSEYLNMQQMKKRLQLVPIVSSQQQVNINTPSKTIILNKDNLPLNQISQTQQQYSQQQYINKNYKKYQNYHISPKINWKQQKTANSFFQQSQNYINTNQLPYINQQPLSVNHSQNDIHSNQSNLVKQSLKNNKPVSPNQINKLQEIQKEHQQFRTKINSISQAVLSMSPLKLQDDNEPIKNNFGLKAQQWPIDQTTEYSPQYNASVNQKQQDQDIDYEYSDDQQSYNNNSNKNITSKNSSSISNKDLSDTRKITYTYGQNSKKKTQNKMKQKKSSIKIQQPSRNNLINQPTQNNLYTQQNNENYRIKKAQIMISNSNFSNDQEKYYQLPKPSFHQISNLSKNVNQNQQINDPNRKNNNLTESMKKQIDNQNKTLYTPIQSSQIIELSSLNSLSFHFIATNYQPSKNSYRQGSILTSSKTNLDSSKHLNINQDKLTRSNKHSKQFINDPIQQEQSLYKPIPFGKPNKSRTQSDIGQNYEQFQRKNNNLTQQNNLNKYVIQKQKLKQSLYGIAQDSVNYYVPIDRANKNVDISLANNEQNKRRRIGEGNIQKILNDESTSQVQYYESRYEFEGFDEQRMNHQGLGNGEDNFYYRRVYGSNDMLQNQRSYSNVIQTMNLNNNNIVDQQNSYR